VAAKQYLYHLFILLAAGSALAFVASLLLVQSNVAGERKLK